MCAACVGLRFGVLLLQCGHPVVDGVGSGADALLGGFWLCQIASASGDGKVLFWSLSNELQYPVQG